MGSTLHPLTLSDEPIENHRPLRVRVIGAGFSGVYLGIRIPQRLRNVELRIYEKNAGIGGTWYENRYPGCACDIPAHSYQYSFAPNLDPGWSGFYASAREICEYIQGAARRFGADRFVRLEHRVVDLGWDDGGKKWRFKVERADTGETFEDEAEVVIVARGALNDAKWPDLRGLDRFKGEIMHSASWKSEYDFRSKKIGVIGSGSSSIQIVPNLQKVEGAKLNVVVRSKVWITNRFGDKTMNDLGLDPSHLSFTEEEKQEFRNAPAKYRVFQKKVDNDLNFAYFATLRGSDMSKTFTQIFTENTKQRLGHKPDILPSFLPPFAVGCRRLTPGPGYLEAVAEDNVNFITSDIDHINEKGLFLTDGRQVDLDVLVCATGFNTSAIPPFPITGRNGLTLGERFSHFAETYLSVAVDSFPNMFFMLGPNSGLGAGSLTILMEAQGDYIVKCLRKLQRENYATIEPKAERVRDFADYADEYFKKTVYTDDCKSWYKKNGRIQALWPGSPVHALETLRSPRWEDFNFESKDGESDRNRLRWLGNGFSETLLGGGDPSWYLNEESIDYPPEGKPEEDPKYKTRCYGV
ncbi:unnamed protein product [Discula destructiva]